MTMGKINFNFLTENIQLSSRISGMNEEINCPVCQNMFLPYELPQWHKEYCSEICSKLDRRKKNPLEYLLACNIPKRYHDCSFENYKTDSGNITAFKTLHGIKKISESIYITGAVGTGKTHLSVALVMKLRGIQPQKANFQQATGILIDLRSGFSKDASEKEALGKFQNNEILIIDDLGAEKVSDYVVQAWYSIIDYRYSNMLPTIITTNLSLDELAGRFGDRVASRISSGTVVTIKGEDKRLEKWRDKK